MSHFPDWGGLRKIGIVNTQGIYTGSAVVFLTDCKWGVMGGCHLEKNCD